MHIGIFTLHYGYNEGAVLQALALSRTVNELTGGPNTDVMDFRYRRKWEYINRAPVDSRIEAIRAFVASELPLSDKQLCADDHRAALAYAQDRYSGVLVGSDEVWKLRYRKRWLGLRVDQPHPAYPPFPNLYWPESDVPVAAYAASAGRTDWRHIPASHRRRMAQILERFRAIGVRDARTRRFLQWIDPAAAERAEITPDPTFLLKIPHIIDADSVRSRMASLGVDFGRRIALVLLKDHAPAAGAIRKLRDSGYQVLGLSERNPHVELDLSAANLQPLEWAGLFRFADVCVSQRMHGCIMALQANRPLVAVDFYRHPQETDSKIIDLLAAFGLEEHVVDGHRDDTSAAITRTVAQIEEGAWPAGRVDEESVRRAAAGRAFLSRFVNSLEPA